MGVNEHGVAISIGDPLLIRPRPVEAVDVEGAYRRHAVRLGNLAAAITLDRSLAEEVVQDAFAGLHQRRFVVADPAAYLQRAVVNRSISVLRRRRVAGSHPLPLAPVSIDPEIDETWGAVTALPPRERAAVVLRYWLDLSEADIAASLGWPNGTVKSTLHRALRRLREELQP
jgi:DNA-directed RNA polymerase specialized sigma24 family protein